MENLVDQIEASTASRFYYISLFAALSVPDIAGALDSNDGLATGAKYAAWYEAWVRPRFQEQLLAEIPELRTTMKSAQSPLTGEDCYRFRCSLLHQGSSQHPKSAFERIIFIEPGATTTVCHYNTLNNALNIDVNLFCLEVVAGTRLWLKTAQTNPQYLQNYQRFARRHPDGLSPYIGGVPVIG